VSWGSYGLDLGQTRSAADAPLYAAAPLDAHPLGSDQFVVRERESGRTAVLAANVLQALQACAAFAPIERHVQNVCARFGGLHGQESAVRGVLQDLAQRGLLLRADAWLDALRAAPAASAAPFRTLIIRTCERPRALSALLDSLRDHALRWRSGHRYVLVDMSRDPQAVALNREALAAFAASSGCAVAHFDRARQTRHLQELVDALPEHAEGLGHLLGDCGAELGYHGDYGVSLNWMHLLGAGERYALLDDDHLFPLRWHPHWKPGLQLLDQAETPAFFASVDEALGSGRESDTDPLAAHSALCGATLSQLLSAPSTRIDTAALAGLAPAALPRLGPQGRVTASTHGHRGDTCAMGLLWLLSLPAGARPAAFASHHAYAAAMQRPAVAQVSSRFRRLDSCGVTPFMIDGSQLMPAVPPRGRGEDGVFCAQLGCVHREGMLVELPLGIGHRRPAPPDRSGYTHSPITPALAHVLAEQLRQAARGLAGADPTLRLRATAALLQSMASVSDAEAAEFLKSSLIELRAGAIHGLRHALQDAPTPPPHWALDQTTLIEANGRALLDDAPARFAEWPADTDAQTGAGIWKGYLSRYASGLHGWPDAIGIARARAPAWIASS